MTTTVQPYARGDVVVVGGRRVGERARMGEVLEVLGPSDRPHFAVRWEDGHESILYPGETTTITHRTTAAAPAPEATFSATTRQLVEGLRDAGMEFELLPHRRTTTAVAEARALGVLPQAVAKTVIARDADGGCVRAVVPASSHVSRERLAEALSAVSVEILNEGDLVAAYPQFELGAVPPFGGPAGDRVVVDRRIAESDHVVFDAGAHDASLRMRTDELLSAASALVADIALD